LTAGGLFSLQAFALQINQKHGLQSFALLRSRFPLLQQNLEAPSGAHDPHLLADFTRGCSAVEKSRE